jgi:hypothetical protein
MDRFDIVADLERERVALEGWRDPGDGWVAAAIPLAVPLIQAVVHPTNAKDAQRFATADAWYAQARNGDATALCMLSYMGGRRGTGSCGGSTAGGFATQAAKDYTEQLYQQVLAIQAGTLPPSTPMPLAPNEKPTNTTPSGTGQVIGAIGTLATNTATALGTTPQPTAAQQAGLVEKWGGYALLLAGVGVAAYLIMRRR